MWNLFRRLVGMESNEMAELRANAGDAAAQSSLGYAYSTGQGVPQDDVEAVSWTRKAAKQGNAIAQYNLGIAYDLGQGVPQDYVEAVSWTRKAAKQGLIGAQSSLGESYRDGKGVRKNYAKAVSWWRKAADRGDPGSQGNLGFAYRKGQGVPQDDVEAHKWYNLAVCSFRKAEEHGGGYGRANARSHLGFMYAHGLGVPQDYAKAAELYRSAFSGGHGYAWAYKGPRNHEDDVEAHKWFNVYASIYGEESEYPTWGEKSAKNRDDKAESMTPRAVADAQQRATDLLTAFEQSGEKAGGVAYFKKTVTDGPVDGWSRKKWYEERYPK